MTTNTPMEIKAAIQMLMNISQVKAEAVKVITDALANQEMTLEDWHSLFDGQGASIAIAKKIYSPALVRLITLRAIVIPETLPEFLNWLDIQPRGKLKEHQTDCLNFQEKISKQIPPTQLSKGIKLLLIQLIEEEITPAAFKVLFMKGSAWARCLNEFINDIRYDLEIIAKHGDSPQSYQSFADDSLKNKPVWKKLISYWKSRKADYYEIPDYLPLAQLLEELKHYDLSAYFYQLSKRSVPKKVLSASNVKSSFLGLQLKPEVTLLDHVINFFSGGHIVPIQAVILITFILSGFTGLSGFFMGSQLSKTRNQNQAPPATSPTPTPRPTMPPQLLNAAIKDDKFKTTTSSIKNIIKELTKDSQPSKKTQPDKETTIKQKLQEILAYEGEALKFIQKIDTTKPDLKLNDQQKRLLAQAIYNYQQKINQDNTSQINGIIDENNFIYHQLKNDLKAKLQGN
jgi:hypothetical protein